VLKKNSLNKCLIKVTGFDGKGKKLGVDKSDTPFSIEVVAIKQPNGGEVLLSGNPTDIAWKWHATAGDIAQVILSYTLDGGITWKKIDTISGDGGGLYSWPLPTVTKQKTKCKVKIVLKAPNGVSLGSDTSDAVFTINPKP
jgi:hypothetical protein